MDETMYTIYFASKWMKPHSLTSRMCHYQRRIAAVRKTMFWCIGKKQAIEATCEQYFFIQLSCKRVILNRSFNL